jgi:hypothetical protein
MTFAIPLPHSCYLVTSRCRTFLNSWVMLKLLRRWIIMRSGFPTGNSGFVNVLDIRLEKVGTMSCHQVDITENENVEVVEKFGGPCRGRTYGPLIKRAVSMTKCKKRSMMLSIIERVRCKQLSGALEASTCVAGYSVSRQ